LPTAKTNEKRERLVESAANLMHRNGMQGPTLAEIAEEADVPLGNVYYYFKTRDDLVQAVIDSWAARFVDLVGELNEEPGPQQRLKGLARFWADESELIAQAGCPAGSLSSDLSKAGPSLRPESSQLFKLLLDWATEQFASLGTDSPSEAATIFLAGVQGASLLSAALEDPGPIELEIAHLEDWIDSLSP
jgi:TetR/AcrR family transcriptional repressor of nem operon